MTASAAPVIVHDSMFYAMSICFGIAFIFAVVGLFVWLYLREEKNRPLVPWGARMSVEREKAYAEREKQRLERDALEIKRMALDHQRTQVLAAIQNDDHAAVASLGLPAGNSEPENGQWTPTLRH